MTVKVTRRHFLKAAGAALALAALGWPRQVAQANTTLRILLPPRTLTDETLGVLGQFGIPQPIPTRANNDQEILDGLSSLLYDLVVVPYHLTSRLISRGVGIRLQPGMLPALRQLPSDYQPGKRMQDPANAFSAPASMGTLGLIYDPAVVDAPGSWRDLVTNARNVVLPNDFEIVVSSLLRAYPNLTALTPDLRTLRSRATESHDPIGQVLRGRAAMTIGGDVQVRGTNLGFVLPAEGSYVWGLDYMIPIRTQASGLAHAFINSALQAETLEPPPRYIDQPNFLSPRVPASASERSRWQTVWNSIGPRP